MIKKFVVVFFLFLPLVSFAEWEPVASSLNEPADLSFIDPSTIIKKNSVVRVWELENFGKDKISTSNNKKYRSEKALVEYDCVDRKRRIFSISRYSKLNSEGSVVFSGDLEEGSNWRFIGPQEISEFKLLRVCNLKK